MVQPRCDLVSPRAHPCRLISFPRRGASEGQGKGAQEGVREDAPGAKQAAAAAANLLCNSGWLTRTSQLSSSLFLSLHWCRCVCVCRMCARALLSKVYTRRALGELPRKFWRRRGDPLRVHTDSRAKEWVVYNVGVDA